MVPDGKAMSPYDEARDLIADTPNVAELWQAPLTQQRTAGYHDTLHEICQQPLTWRATARRVEPLRSLVRPLLAARVDRDPPEGVLLTGSGSSYYIGACLAPALQANLGIVVRPVPSGDLLTHAGSLVPATPCLVVSFARSGDSPESAAVVTRLLEARHVSQLIVTCNAEGRLTRELAEAAGIVSVVLDGRTNDRSLVMTSSFTNLVLAGWVVLSADGARPRLAEVDRLADAGEQVIRGFAGDLAEVVPDRLERVVFLGTAGSHGACLEASLKMLEMTGGAVSTMAESYLGVRHGPMAAIDGDTLVVCFLSSDPIRRAYEADVIDELNRKALGSRHVLVGEGIDSGLLRPGDLAVEWRVDGGVGDELACLLHVMVGQWLGFWRCLAGGLKPDAPSAADVITRVVRPFTLHEPQARGS